MKSVYKDLTKILSPLFAWLGVGWVLFPTLAARIAGAANEPFDVSRAEPIAYFLCALCFGLSLAFWWWGHTTSPVSEAYFEEKGKKLTFKCPYCGKKIGIDEVRCPHCRRKIPR